MNKLKHEDVIPEGAVIDALVLRAPHDAVCRHALEIIRAYRKENGAMQEMVDTAIDCSNHLSGIIEEKDAEIERLNCVIETMEDNCMTCDYKTVDRVSTARAEAITEFEKKLMEKKCHYTETEHTFDFDGVTVEDIEQTAKELKGEPDEL